jgi:dTDP-4-amino-4,6-dideoxygalactose transaminase
MRASQVPFVDLKAQLAGIRPELDAAIATVLDAGQFVLGEEVAQLEQEFASYVGADHAVAVNSGTSALHVALLALGVGPGDEVITVPHTFVATVAAILYTGARAVLVDIDPRSFNMDPARLERAITPRTKAILPVHLYGQPADMDAILAIARQRGVAVLEDACQAHGSEYRNRRVGALGAIGAFSFYPGKNLGAYGEGGIAVTNDAALARTMRMLRDFGQETKYHHVLMGFNYRMESFQGAILRVKLRHLEAWTEARRSHARRYDALLAGCPVVHTPEEMDWARHVYHLYAVRSASRDQLRAKLEADGVQTGIHYPVPVHLQPAYASLGYGPGDFPHAETAAREVLSLPMFPELTEEQIDTVAAVLKR